LLHPRGKKKRRDNGTPERSRVWGRGEREKESQHRPPSSPGGILFENPPASTRGKEGRGTKTPEGDFRTVGKEGKEKKRGRGCANTLAPIMYFFRSPGKEEKEKGTVDEEKEEKERGGGSVPFRSLSRFQQKKKEEKNADPP